MAKSSKPYIVGLTHYSRDPDHKRFDSFPAAVRYGVAAVRTGKGVSTHVLRASDNKLLVACGQNFRKPSAPASCAWTVEGKRLMRRGAKS